MRFGTGHSSDGLPASPPPAVLAEVDAAWEHAGRLAAQDRELHFVHDAQTRRLVIEVRTLAGAVVRTLSPSQALAVMGGGAL